MVLLCTFKSYEFKETTHKVHNVIIICYNNYYSRLCSKENWRELSVINLQNLGCQAYDSYEKTKIIF